LRVAIAVISEQLTECRVASLPVAEVSEHVDRPSIGHPGRAAERAQRLGVELHWKLTSLIVGHPADSQSCVQLQGAAAKRPRLSSSPFGTRSISLVGRVAPCARAPSPKIAP
jgi:hypothetical protein